MPPIDPAAVDAAIACPQCGGELTVFQSGPDSRLPRHLQECRDCDLPYPLWQKWKTLADSVEHCRAELDATMGKFRAACKLLGIDLKKTP